MGTIDRSPDDKAASSPVAARERTDSSEVAAVEADATAKEAIEDGETVLRIEHLPRDVGWLMVYVGVLGVILPGIIGTPFLIAGLAILTPGGPKMLDRWAGRKPRGFVHASLKQISRWLDDLERRYPRLP